jgi:hypothetical protein
VSKFNLFHFNKCLVFYNKNCFVSQSNIIHYIIMELNNKLLYYENNELRVVKHLKNNKFHFTFLIINKLKPLNINNIFELYDNFVKKYEKFDIIVLDIFKCDNVNLFVYDNSDINSIKNKNNLYLFRVNSNIPYAKILMIGFKLSKYQSFMIIMGDDYNIDNSLLNILNDIIHNSLYLLIYSPKYNENINNISNIICINRELFLYFDEYVDNIKINDIFLKINDIIDDKYIMNNLFKCEYWNNNIFINLDNNVSINLNNNLNTLKMSKNNDLILFNYYLKTNTLFYFLNKFISNVLPISNEKYLIQNENNDIIINNNYENLVNNFENNKNSDQLKMIIPINTNININNYCNNMSELYYNVISNI